MTPPSREPAPAEFERIVPRKPVIESRAPATGGGHSAARISAVSLWIAGTVLLVVAILVFAVLPRLVDAPAPPAPVVAGSQPAPPEPATAAAPAPPPGPAAWDDPALLEARAAAQEARTRYEDGLGRLASKGAGTWAAQPLAQGRERAQAGEAAFQSRDFNASRDAFEAAAAITAGLLAGVPQRLTAALESGNRALEAGDEPAARSAFELAALLDPGNAAAARGLARVPVMGAVAAKLQTASRLEQAGDAEGARAAWKDALSLDPDTKAARDGIARLDARAGEAEFNRVMGEALAAIDRGDYDAAEKRLARARTLRASDPAVQQAAQRVTEARRGQKLALLRREAEAKEANEDWSGALERYRAAQQIDASVAFARDGIERSEPRAALSVRLQDFVDRPQRLSVASVQADARTALQQARAISPAGPRLVQQAAALERVLENMSTPVAVQFRSDGQTEVQVYRVGALGRFTTHTQPLKPGSYVAVGSRAGYIDVRKEFDVRPGAQELSVEVRCEERM